VRPRTAHCDRSSSAVLRARSCDDVKDGRPRAGGVGAVSAAVLDPRSELGRTSTNCSCRRICTRMSVRDSGACSVSRAESWAQGERGGHTNSN
jgi:hypothetical protein